jgi:hypothetical protein
MRRIESRRSGLRCLAYWREDNFMTGKTIIERYPSRIVWICRIREATVNTGPGPDGRILKTIPLLYAITVVRAVEGDPILGFAPHSLHPRQLEVSDQLPRRGLEPVILKRAIEVGHRETCGDGKDTEGNKKLGKGKASFSGGPDGAATIVPWEPIIMY